MMSRYWRCFPKIKATTSRIYYASPYGRGRRWHVEAAGDSDLFILIINIEAVPKAQTVSLLQDRHDINTKGRWLDIKAK